MMKNKYGVFYWSSLVFLLLVSCYPIYMGVKTLLFAIEKGAVRSEDYPKYIIPYTPICIALIMVAALYPVIYKVFKKYALPVGSVLGLGIFLAAETGFEKFRVIEGYTVLPLESWQYSLCIATPEVLRAIGEPIYAENNPAFKVHFYIIAMIIVLTVIGLIHGFTRMIKENDTSRKKPLIAQAVCVTVFVGLCILACFTAFYRNGTLYISAISAFLMSLFFIVFGVTFGVYLGCIFYGLKRFWSVMLPSLAAVVTTLAMYMGELVLMNGVLFKYGRGFFFSPIGTLPFAAVDYLVMLLSGLISWLILRLLNQKSYGQKN
jgi:hypothetical protein